MLFEWTLHPRQLTLALCIKSTVITASLIARYLLSRREQCPFASVPAEEVPRLARTWLAHVLLMSGQCPTNRGLLSQRGVLPRVEELTWPPDPFPATFAKTLSDLEMPRFCRRYPPLLTTLMKQMLDLVEVFHDPPASHPLINCAAFACFMCCACRRDVPKPCGHARLHQVVLLHTFILAS